MSIGMIIALIKKLGVTPDPSVIESAVDDYLEEHPEATCPIDDTAGEGDTGKVWSADKTAGEVATLTEAITKVSESTWNIVSVGVGRYTGNTSNGNITNEPNNGNIFGLSDKVPCEEDEYYAISMYSTNKTKGTIYVFFYGASGFISYTSIANNTFGFVKTPENTTHIFCYQYNGSGIAIDANSGIQIEKGYAPTQYIKHDSAVDEVARNGNPIDIPVEIFAGYFNSSGVVQTPTSANEKYTSRVDVTLFSSIGVSLEYGESRSLWVAYATYDADGHFISRTALAERTTDRYGSTITFASGVRYVAFTYRAQSDGIFKVYGIPSLMGIANLVMANHEAILPPQMPILKTLPCYDHLFVGTSAQYITIPHESVFHVRLTRLMGFNAIEANIAKTSDGVYVVNHLASGGKFGGYFHHVDGQTDISDTTLESVTWDWVVQNVRYNSTIAKYRTRPCRLEEFLSECRQQNVIPWLTCSETAVIKMADKIMGKDNYIAYTASREDCPTATIYHWMSKSTKADILAYCESIGKPFIYGMSNPNSFTDAQLREIVDALHEKGYWIGVSYADDDWYKYSYLGFDVNGTQKRINRITDGNICNLDSVFGFDSFTMTNATEADGALTFTSAGTITPDIDVNSMELCGVDIEVVFNGSITIPAVGEQAQSKTYTSDGSYPFFMAVPIISGSPKVTISVASGTVITDLKYKATKF